MSKRDLQRRLLARLYEEHLAPVVDPTGIVAGQEGPQTTEPEGTVKTAAFPPPKGEGMPMDEDEGMGEGLPEVKTGGAGGAGGRNIPKDHPYDPKALRPMAKALWAASVSLGHALTAYRSFSRLKSATISPDGMLGGRGYVMKIGEVRKRLYDACESLSAITDTLHDEITAPHWKPRLSMLDDNEIGDVENYVEESKGILDSPEDDAEEEARVLEEENDGDVLGDDDELEDTDEELGDEELESPDEGLEDSEDLEGAPEDLESPDEDLGEEELDSPEGLEDESDEELEEDEAPEGLEDDADPAEELEEGDEAEGEDLETEEGSEETLGYDFGEGSDEDEPSDEEGLEPSEDLEESSEEEDAEDVPQDDREFEGQVDEDDVEDDAEPSEELKSEVELESVKDDPAPEKDLPAEDDSDESGGYDFSDGDPEEGEDEADESGDLGFGEEDSEDEESEEEDEEEEDEEDDEDDTASQLPGTDASPEAVSAKGPMSKEASSTYSYDWSAMAHQVPGGPRVDYWDEGADVINPPDAFVDDAGNGPKDYDYSLASSGMPTDDSPTDAMDFGVGYGARGEGFDHMSQGKLPGDTEEPVARSDYYPDDRGNMINTQSLLPGTDSAWQTHDLDLVNTGYTNEDLATPYDYRDDHLKG